MTDEPEERAQFVGSLGHRGAFVHLDNVEAGLGMASDGRIMLVSSDSDILIAIRLEHLIDIVSEAPLPADGLQVITDIFRRCLMRLNAALEKARAKDN